MWNLEIFSQQKVGEYLLVMSYEMTGRECTGESNGKLRRSSGSGGEGRMCCDTGNLVVALAAKALIKLYYLT